MEYMEHKIECGVCGIVLPSDANRAITTCKHAFCISCLLKWYRVNPTCPMCRRLLHDEDDEEDEEDKEDADPAQARAEEEHIRQLIIQTDRIFEELEFNMEEEITQRSKSLQKQSGPNVHWFHSVAHHSKRRLRYN